MVVTGDVYVARGPVRNSLDASGEAWLDLHGVPRVSCWLRVESAGPWTERALSLVVIPLGDGTGLACVGFDFYPPKDFFS